MNRRIRGRVGSGQATVEFAVVFPVLVAVAFIAANALVFLGDCAAFDSIVRDAVRLQADDGFEGQQGAVEVCARVEGALDMPHERVQVTCSRVGVGHVRYTAETAFSPPFLRGVSVFGVSVPPLKHEVSFVVSPYRKGVVV